MIAPVELIAVFYKGQWKKKYKGINDITKGSPTMLPYNPNFLEIKPIFSSSELDYLDSLQKDMPLTYFLESKSLNAKFGFDFVYSSAKIEGNTYTKAETLNLLEMGVTAGGKKYTDAVMLVNLRSAFDFIAINDIEINRQSLCHIHSMLAKNLVQDNNLGIMRQIQIDGISGCAYVPLPFGERLDREMEYLFKQYEKIENPFEKALYLHNNLAYLQYFEDCNKRTARTMQFISLKNSHIMPLIITKDSKELYAQYRESLITYYENGDYTPSKDFFIQNYEVMQGYFQYSKIK